VFFKKNNKVYKQYLNPKILRARSLVWLERCSYMCVFQITLLGKAVVWGSKQFSENPHGPTLT